VVEKLEEQNCFPCRKKYILDKGDSHDYQAKGDQNPVLKSNNASKKVVEPTKRSHHLPSPTGG